jgi:hypothetical protein
MHRIWLKRGDMEYTLDLVLDMYRNIPAKINRRLLQIRCLT